MEREREPAHEPVGGRIEDRTPRTFELFRRLRLFRKEVRVVHTDVRKEAVLPAPEYDPDAPLVIVSCPNCGPEYDVTPVDLGDGRSGAVWTCSCGHRYIPAGGLLSERFVRP